jgi:aspartate beta-hydroxylase
MDVDPQTAERLESAAAELARRFPPGELRRIQGLLRILSGEEEPKRLPLQEPRAPRLFVPDLRTTPWLDPSSLPWVRALEERWQAVRAELEALLASGAPVSGYEESAGEGIPAVAPGWDAFYLVRHRSPDPGAAARCPQTAAALSEVPVATEAFFSVLRPGAAIPRHTDPSNFVVACHLPLLVPDGCGLEVGEVPGRWTPGRCILIDTSFWHEVWNRSDRPRVTLNIDTWHPDLTEVERGALAFLSEELYEAMRRHLRPERSP